MAGSLILETLFNYGRTVKKKCFHKTAEIGVNERQFTRELAEAHRYPSLNSEHPSEDLPMNNISSNQVSAASQPSVSSMDEQTGIKGDFHCSAPSNTMHQLLMRATDNSNRFTYT